MLGNDVHLQRSQQPPTGFICPGTSVGERTRVGGFEIGMGRFVSGRMTDHRPSAKCLTPHSIRCSAMPCRPRTYGSGSYRARVASFMAVPQAIGIRHHERLANGDPALMPSRFP